MDNTTRATQEAEAEIRTLTLKAQVKLTKKIKRSYTIKLSKCITEIGDIH